MIKFLLRTLYISFRELISGWKFRYRVYRMGGMAGRPLKLFNPKDIIIGKKVNLKSGYRIECYEVFYNQKLSPQFIIEDGVIIGNGFTGFVASDLKIGKNTIFAGNVTLITENHGMDPESNIPFHAQPLTVGPISIGEGCWLGQNVSVLPNVKIGNRCVIATNAVVTSNIPDYSIAAGCPARIIKRYNFTKHIWERV